MNRIFRTLLICTIVFASSTMRAAQISKTEPKIEPIEFDIDKYLFVIHPKAIHIYDKLKVFLAVTQQQRKDTLDNYGFNKIGTIYDQDNSDKKLTGEEYKKALELCGFHHLSEIGAKNFIAPFKEIVQNNNLDINSLNTQLVLPFGESYMGRAIRENNLETVKVLIELGSHVNTLPCLQRAIWYKRPEIIKMLLLAGANIWDRTNAKLYGPLCNIVSEVYSEVYNAREAEQMQLPHKIFLAKNVGNVKKLADEIIEYLLGKSHKVMAISECKKALEE